MSDNREGVYLCIISDDFGMHPAINEGIVKAFVDGLLTSTNIMPPCPAFGEAARLARQHHLPVGFHATLTCDWNVYRWGTLTGARSLATAAGYLKDRVAKAWRGARDDEVAAELEAQLACIEAEGLQPVYVCEHMGADRQGRLYAAWAALGVARTGPARWLPEAQREVMPAFEWRSLFSTSTYSLDYRRRKAFLKRTLRKLEPGFHAWIAHAAVDHPDLDNLCTPDFHAFNWARPYRALDLALLLDPEIGDLLAELGIQRVGMESCPVRGRFRTELGS